MNQPQTVIPPVVDLTTVVTFLTGIFLPWAIAWLRSSDATRRYAALLSFGVCFLVALVETFLLKTFQGAWSVDVWENVRLVILNVSLTLMAAWTTYQHLWSPLGLTDKLEGSGPQLGAQK